VKKCEPPPQRSKENQGNAKKLLKTNLMLFA